MEKVNGSDFTQVSPNGNKLLYMAKFMCPVCNKIVNKRKDIGKISNTCSATCRGKTKKGTHYGPRKRVVVSKKYYLAWRPDHPSAITGRVPEHRLIVEDYIGRFLSSEEHVHHIDGDGFNNKIENLQILTNSEHTRLHQRSHTSMEQVLEIRMLLKKKNMSHIEIAEKVGVKVKMVGAINEGRTFKDWM